MTEEQELALRELARRKEQEKCQWFVPNGKQEAYIKAVGEGKHFIYLFVASNAIGKDCVVANILANVIWGPQNEYFKNLPLYEKWPYPKYIRVVTESQLVQEAGPLAKEIRTWWPKGRYEAKNAGKQYPSQYRTDTGFYVDVMTYEQEPEEFEGVTLGLAVCSEPPTKDIFNRLVSRMRQGGIILIVMTPLTSAAWIQDELMDSKDTFVLGADIEDGCKEHGIRGHLNHVDIERMLAHWDPDEIEARAHGKFMHLSNVILGRSFNRAWHVIPDDVACPDGAQWGYTVDPHGSKPFAIGYWWVSPTGQIVFESEYPIEDFTRIKDCKLVLKDYVDMWKTWERGRSMHSRIIDRHFANARDYRGRTLKQELEEEFGIEFTNSYNCEEEIEQGILKVKAYLDFDKTKPISTINQPKLLIKSRCKNIIRAMERWSRDPETLKPDLRSPYKDHFDVVRYTVMAEPQVEHYRPFVPIKTRYTPGR